MVLLTIFKNKKAFSLVELIIAMIIASVIMLSVYFMLIIAYGQFNSLTEESERFNNLQVFERMFQRSAMTCSYYEVKSSTFCFYSSNKTEEYIFGKINDAGKIVKIEDEDFCNITEYNKKLFIYSEKIDSLNNNIDDNYKIDEDKSYKLIYRKEKKSISSVGTGGYLKPFKLEYTSKTDEEQKVLFDNIVKVYYETSKNIEKSNFEKFTGKELLLDDKVNEGLKQIYTPFIKLIIIYKDNNGKLRRSYIACRLRGIEGIELKD